MEIWIEQNSKKFRIPVLPAEYDITSGQVNTEVNINALGTINLRGNRGLIGVTFESFFPKEYASYCEYSSLKTPKASVKLIEDMKRAGAVRLKITGTTINGKFTIEEFDWNENDGTGDVNYTLTFKEYRNVSIPQSTIVKSSTTQSSQTEDSREQPVTDNTTTYTVKSGDCLSKIARELTGSASWQSIYEANKSVIGSNPNKIQVGMVLTIQNTK